MSWYQIGLIVAAVLIIAVGLIHGFDPKPFYL